MKLASIFGDRVTPPAAATPHQSALLTASPQGEAKTGEHRQSAVGCRRAFVIACVDGGLRLAIVLGGIFGVALLGGWLVTLAGVA